ncbi:MAG: MBL fold metallo-hydrolase [Ignavibacteriales bacterium]|nr:MBL fold metallo-hydrolase [Ignavibacteriales bacterium]
MFFGKIVNIFLMLMGVMIMQLLCGCSVLYNGAPSDHFDGSRFFNKEPDHNFWDEVKWLWQMDTVEWPEYIEDDPQPKPESYVGDGKLKVTYINHATVLIQVDSLNILTDPIWSEYAGPFSWFSPKRIRKPGVDLNDLPKIDFILISHDHYDHLDLKTLEQLLKKHHPVILAGLGIKELLEDEGFDNVYELDWWNEYKINSSETKFIFVPSLHGSGRTLFGGNRTLWGGFVIQSKSGNIYFAGDTGYGNFLDSLKKKFSDFRLTILPVGNYEKRWFMKTQHMNPEDAVKTHRLLNSRQSIGIHYATFAEHPEQAVDAHEKDLKSALVKYNMPDSSFLILRFGEGLFVE